MTKILIVIDSLNRGGTERHLSLILPALQRKKNQIIVCLISGGIEYNEFKKNKLIKVIEPPVVFKSTNIFIKLLKLLFFTFNYLKIELLWKPNIVNYYLPQSLIIGGFLSFFCRKTIRISSRRGLNDYKSQGGLVDWVERFLRRNIDYYFVNCEALKRELIGEGIDKEKIFLIYNGINILKQNNFHKIQIRKKIRKNHNIQPNDILIIKVANLIPYKGHQVLLEALTRIDLDVQKRIVVLFIGKKNKNILKFQKFLKTKKSKIKLKVLGKKINIYNYLYSSDIFSLTPIANEGFSNALLEAGMCKLPSVVSNIGGNPEIIKNNENGFVCDHKDLNSIKAAIVKLISNKKLRIKMGENSYNKIKLNFSLDIIVDKYQDTFETLLSSKKNHG